MDYLKIPAYAKQRRCSPEIIRRHIKTGKIEAHSLKRVGKRWLIDPKRADKDLESNLDRLFHRPPKKQNRQKKRNIKSERKPTTQEKLDVIEKAGFGSLSLARAQELHENFKAALKKLEYDEKSGKLVDVETLERLFFDAGRKVRDQLLAIPDRCAALVAASYGGDQHECREILKKEITNVCAEIAGSAKKIYL